MKTLNDFVIEKLNLNSDSKIRKHNEETIPTKFSNALNYTQKDINIVQEYAQKLKVKPILISNYFYNYVTENIKDTPTYLNIYFDKKWEKDYFTHHISFKRNGYNDNKWCATILLAHHGCDFKSLEVIDKNWKQLFSENVKDICKATIDQLDGIYKEFYDAVKKNQSKL